MREKGYTFSAQSFYDYYQATEWHQANGRPVRRWKACCVTWQNNDCGTGSNRKGVAHADYSEYDTAFYG